MKKIDREIYAEVIAAYIVGTSAAETYSGNYCTYFEEIDKIFGTNLCNYQDNEMVELIKNAMVAKGDIVSDVEVYGGCFDVMIYTSFCPKLDEEA